MTREEEINNASYAYWVNNYANIEFIDEEEKELHTQDIQESFINGAEWADAHSHWISVDVELPPKQPNREQSKNVLVRTNSGRTKIEYYDYGNDVIKEWWEYNITHWMPLPEAPKEGGEE